MFLSLIYRDRRGRAAIENRIGFLRSYLRWRGQGSHYPAITCKSNWLWEEPRIAYQQSPHVLFYLASTGIETQLKAIKESMPIPASLYKKWKTPPAMTAEEIWFTTTRLSKVISRPQIVKISTQDVLLNPSLTLLIEIVQSGIWDNAAWITPICWDLLWWGPIPSNTMPILKFWANSCHNLYL